MLCFGDFYLGQRYLVKVTKRTRYVVLCFCETNSLAAQWSAFRSAFLVAKSKMVPMSQRVWGS